MEQKKVIRHSLSEQAELLIRERIIALDFGPGERMVVDTLAAQLGVSRTPIREGLRSLVQQGLVNYDGKSYTLFSPTITDIEEIFTVRKALEPVAAQLATERISPEGLEDLRLLFKQHSLIEADQALAEIDVHFHNAIMAGAGNKRIEQILSNMRSQFQLIRSWVAKRNKEEIGERQNLPEIETINEHRIIFEYILKKNSEEASRAMYEHLENGRLRMIHNLFDPPVV